MGAPRAPYMAKTDKERLATGFWNRIESNQATDYNTNQSSKQGVIYSTLSQLSLASPNFGLIAHEKCTGCDLSPEKPCVSTDLET